MCTISLKDTVYLDGLSLAYKQVISRSVNLKLLNLDALMIPSRFTSHNFSKVDFPTAQVVLSCTSGASANLDKSFNTVFILFDSVEHHRFSTSFSSLFVYPKCSAVRSPFSGSQLSQCYELESTFRVPRGNRSASWKKKLSNSFLDLAGRRTKHLTPRTTFQATFSSHLSVRYGQQISMSHQGMHETFRRTDEFLCWGHRQSLVDQIFQHEVNTKIGWSLLFRSSFCSSHPRLVLTGFSHV